MMAGIPSPNRGLLKNTTYGQFNIVSGVPVDQPADTVKRSAHVLLVYRLWTGGPWASSSTRC